MFVKLVSSMADVRFVCCMPSREGLLDSLLKRGTSFAKLMMSEITPLV